MSALEKTKECAPVPLLKNAIGAALHAHGQVLAAPVGGSVQVPAALWAQIASALKDAKAWHDMDLSSARVTDRMSIDGQANRDQLIEIFVPIGEGLIHGVMGDVKPDQKGGPDARISWPSIGAVRPDVARAFALGIVRAADLADVGLAEKLEAAPAAGLARTARAKNRP